MNNPYTSNELHHFVGARDPAAHENNWATLCLILDAGCVSHPPHSPGYGSTQISVDFRGALEEESLLVPSVTCFADIPEGSLRHHVDKYGFFGLSFSRDFLVRRSARPVMYVPMVPERWPGGPALGGRGLLDDIGAVYEGLDDYFELRSNGEPRRTRSLGVKPVEELDVLGGVKSVFELSLLAYIKPFDATLPPGDKNCFYMEREWRLLGNLPFTNEQVERVWLAPGYLSAAARRYPSLASKMTELA